MMNIKGVHVDRENELQLFRSMLSGDGDAHILLIQADGGMGKTSLIEEFWKACRGMTRVLIDLKRGSDTVDDILQTIVDEFGGHEVFRRYSRSLRPEVGRTGGLSIDIDESKVSKVNIDDRSTTISLGVGGPPADLTQAFFDDLRDLPREGNGVVIFDTYERASSEVQEWIGGRFFRLARSLRWLVVVIAGREIPEQEIWWDEWLISQTLRPLAEEHVRQYLQRLELHYGEEAITVLYRLSRGQPLQLASLVASLLGNAEAAG